MLNKDRTEYSQNIINEQMDYVKAAYPFIKQVIKIDPAENLLADYIYGVDAIGIDTRGNSHKIQFKHREAGKNDLVLPAIKLTGKNVEANNLGFDYKGNTYTFRPYADIYVETIAGKHYSFTADELFSIEKLWADRLQSGLTGVEPKYFYNDNGEKFFSGEFMAFMPIENMQRSQQGLLQIRF